MIRFTLGDYSKPKGVKRHAGVYTCLGNYLNLDIHDGICAKQECFLFRNALPRLPTRTIYLHDEIKKNNKTRARLLLYGRLLC